MQVQTLKLRVGVGYLSAILILPLLVLADDLVSFSDEMLDFLLGADEELFNVLTDEAMYGGEAWLSELKPANAQIHDGETQLKTVQVETLEESDRREREQ